jgi:hypothetical protein
MYAFGRSIKGIARHDVSRAEIDYGGTQGSPVAERSSMPYVPLTFKAAIAATALAFSASSSAVANSAPPSSAQIAASVSVQAGTSVADTTEAVPAALSSTEEVKGFKDSAGNVIDPYDESDEAIETDEESDEAIETDDESDEAIETDEGTLPAEAALIGCKPKTGVDNPHVSSSALQVSGHGWWNKGTCDGDRKAKVKTCLYELYTDGFWHQKACKTRKLKTGRSKSSNARHACSTVVMTGWLNVVDVDVIGQIDSGAKGQKAKDVPCRKW